MSQQLVPMTADQDTAGQSEPAVIIFYGTISRLRTLQQSHYFKIDRL